MKGFSKATGTDDKEPITDFKSDEKTPSSVHLRSDSGYSVEKWLRGIHVIR